MISTRPGLLVNAEGFLKKFGGAPANTAIGLAKLGIPASFMGKVGNDPFGDFLAKTLDDYGVNTKFLFRSKTKPTTLAFVSLTADGKPDFVFYKGAHDDINGEEITLPSETQLVHLCSVVQSSAQGRAATDKIIDIARKKGVMISYDPNIRPRLWNDEKLLRQVILSTARKVDYLKVSEEELSFLTGTKTIEKGAEKLWSKNLDALFVTLGEKGCFYKTARFLGYVKGKKVRVVDTTGAGDAFNAGYIHMVYSSRKKVSEMEKEEIEKGLYKATIIAGLTATKKGAIEAFPTEAELSKLL